MNPATSSHDTDPVSGIPAPPGKEHAVPVRPRPPISDRAVLIPLAIVLAFVVLTALLFDGLLLPLGQPGTHPPPTPIGTALEFGGVSAGNCTVPLAEAAICVVVGDLLYDVSVAASTLTYGSFRLEVELSGGAVFNNTGDAEFSIVKGGFMTARTDVGLGGGLVMSAGWAQFASGTSVSSNLTTACSIFIDVGQSWTQTPSSLTLTAIGQAGYTGTVSVTLTR